MGAGGGSDYLDDLAASEGNTTVLPDEVEATDVPETPEPIWEQDPTQAALSESAPKEAWTIYWHGWEWGEITKEMCFVMMSRREIEGHFQTNTPIAIGNGSFVPVGSVYKYALGKRKS